MGNNLKLRIKTSNHPAVIITRTALKADKLVYFALANKRRRYAYGQSRIVYIGTTKVGAGRIAASAAKRADELLKGHGVKTLTFHIVTCTRRSPIKTWRKLERALLITFREKYGVVPLANDKGKKMKWTDERDYFSCSKLEKTIMKYEK